MSTITHKTRMMGTALVALLVMMAGCTGQEDVLPQAGALQAEPQVSGSRAESSSVVASDDKLNEASLAGGLQVFIFDQAGHKVLYHRVADAQEGVQSVLGTGNWMQTLGLAEGQTYDVYAIANEPAERVAACNSVADLEALTLTDDNIYKVHTQADKKYFLMDQHIQWTPTADSKQVIKLDGLRRAAAKVQLDLNVDVDGYEAGAPKFRFVNYNISTSLLEKDSERQVSVREMEHYDGNSISFKGEDGLVWNRYVAYSYSFSWAGDMLMRPSILVEVPMTKQGEQTARYYYYRIPVRSTGDTSLERNHIYRVKAAITTLGASSELKADVEANVQYSVLPWQVQDVDVNVPDRKFLMVTPELVFMRNVATDDSSIKFYASSACTLTISEVYYYDKKNQKQTIAKGKSQYPTVKLNGTNDGTVSINSPIPDNLTVKYIKLRIALASDASTYKEVLVKQYPIEYAQSISGWYSSRSTAGWITPDNKYGKYCDMSYGWGNYGYYAKEYKNGQIYYLNGNSKPSRVSGLSNNEMYVIQITSTNGKYVISHPNIDYSNPSSSSYGSKDQVVSPAFMIASQLGAVSSGGFDEKSAITHCKTYREVAQDGTVYDGWRLPTNEEVKVIVDYQGKNNSPIDKVLTGSHYRTLSQGEEATSQSGGSGKYVRCVRDLSAEEIEKLENQKK